MCTAGPNDNLWLTEATGMDTNGCDVSNQSKISLLWTMRDVVGPHGDNMKNWTCCNYGM